MLLEKNMDIRSIIIQIGMVVVSITKKGHKTSYRNQVGSKYSRITSSGDYDTL